MHMARHLQPDAFKCDECGYIVTRPRFLQSHKQTHLPEDQKPYACPQDGCTRKFCWKNALQIHLISHQPVSERKQYICQCGRSYDTPGGLSTHKKQVHGPKTPNVSSNICHLVSFVPQKRFELTLKLRIFLFSARKILLPEPDYKNIFKLYISQEKRVKCVVMNAVNG